jgi:hypothetical protein
MNAPAKISIDFEDLSKVDHHPAIEEIAQILALRTGQTDINWFRIIMAHFLAKMASNMRTTIIDPLGEMPVNMYVCALATSGFGKGHSLTVIREKVINRFTERFKKDTFPLALEQNLWKLASEASAFSGKPEQDEFNRLEKLSLKRGPVPFTFAGGNATPQGVRQTREKLQLANIGAISMQTDEIGSNLTGASDVLDVFLELFDVGMVDQSLTKNTVDNERMEEMDGRTPTNMLLFGTQHKLLDSGPTQKLFLDFLATGFGRRCFFAYGVKNENVNEMTAEEKLNHLLTNADDSLLRKWSTFFADLADPARLGWRVNVSFDVKIQHMEYQNLCITRAHTMKDSEQIAKAEMEHRHSKAYKLAGALAFIDESQEMTLSHLSAAIKLTEEQDADFKRVMAREHDFVKLAKYISDQPGSVTHADLVQELSFYSESKPRQNDLLSMAASWGHDNHVIIRRSFDEGIEFMSGETLEQTNIEEMICSYSTHQAVDFEPVHVPWDCLHQLVAESQFHWSNHHYLENHRHMANLVPGFNMIVLDVDGTCSLQAAHELLSDYTFMTYTSKRHTEEEHRFRMIFPIPYILKLNREDHQDFISNFRDWLPFETDDASEQPEKKWNTHIGQYHHNEGRLVDVLKFIPKTKKNKLYQEQRQEIQNMDSLERYFSQRMVHGQRNNEMFKYASMLAENGMDIIGVESAIMSFNAKLATPMDTNRIRNTILVSIGKKLHGI